jgi:MFS transporter, UMF1 family
MSDRTDAAPRPTGTRREIVSWALYDWANSAYTTLSISAMMYYLKEVVAPEDSAVARQISSAASAIGSNLAPEGVGEFVWAMGLAGAMLTAALLSPFVGAMADARATKRWWLCGTAFIGSVCPIVMSLVPAENGWTQIALFITASLFFDLSFGFYNGFLPELADESTMNRVSAWGFAAGYLGGGIALGIELIVLTYGAALGIPDPVDQLRFGLFLMGAWWAVFTIPAMLFLRDRSPPEHGRMSLPRAARDAVGRVMQTLKHIRRYKMLVIFLIGFLFYNDGIQTVIAQAGSFAETDLGFEASELLTLVLAFQFISLFGALIDSVLTDRIGQKRALMIYLGVWVASLGTAYFVTEKIHLWLLAIPLGLVMGGAQTVSRSIMAMMTPPKQNAEFFGFFNFSGRATSWMGNATFAVVIAETNSGRLAIMSLFVFFVIGWGFAAMVDVGRGRREALTAEAE